MSGMAGPARSLSFGGYQGAASVHTRGAQAFGEYLAGNLDGALDFELIPSVIERGHKAGELLEMVEDGRLDLCYFSASYLAARVPEIALLDLPFTYPDRAKAYAVLDGPLGRRIADEIDQNTGYRLLAFWDNGFRHFSNSVRPIRTPADCAGLRIRTLFSDLHQQVFRCLGFEPVALDVKDLISGIADGSIPAQENPLTNAYNFGILEKHRYITLSSHFFGAAALLMNAQRYGGLTDGQRRAVDAAALAATETQRALADAEDGEMLTKLAETDAELVHLSDAERAQFVAAVAPVIDEQRERFGDALMQYLD